MVQDRATLTMADQQ